MSPAWLNNFVAFLNNMGLCPAGFTLERKNNDGDYEPGNCIWAHQSVQKLNRSTTQWFEFNGKRMCETAFANAAGVHRSRIYKLRKNGLTHKEIVSKLCP